MCYMLKISKEFATTSCNILDILSNSNYLYSGDPKANLLSSVMSYCVEDNLGAAECSECIEDISQYLYNKELQRFPLIQNMPTPSAPFVFLHIEKSAGSTLRKHIADSADTHGLEYFIPCHKDIHCVTLNIQNHIHRKNLNNVSVIAGHFFWDVWQQLPSYNYSNSKNNSNNNNNYSNIMQDNTASIFIMGRHPVTRAISYYYQRCHIVSNCIGYNRMMNDLTTEELKDIMYGRRAEVGEDGRTFVIVDEGIEDAACRTIANEKHSSGLLVVELPNDELPRPHPLTETTINKALSNIDKSVIGLLENWKDTVRVLKFWFPWLDVSRDLRVLNDNVKLIFLQKENLNTLRTDLRKVIEDSNRCDLLLYGKMQSRFREQVQMLEYDAFLVN
eukprot:gene11968-25071_t